MKKAAGLYTLTGYRGWLITWPYRTERYLFFGSETNVKRYAKKLTTNWPHEPKIKELQLHHM